VNLSRTTKGQVEKKRGSKHEKKGKKVDLSRYQKGRVIKERKCGAPLRGDKKRNRSHEKAQHHAGPSVVGTMWKKKGCRAGVVKKRIDPSMSPGQARLKV